MEHSRESKEEINNTVAIQNTRKEYKKELKLYAKQYEVDKKPYCRRCIKQDWELGEYDAEDKSVYYDLTRNDVKCKTQTKSTKFGTRLVQDFTHYDCSRGHGVCMAGELEMQGMIVRDASSVRNPTVNNGNKRNGIRRTDV